MESFEKSHQNKLKKIDEPWIQEINSEGEAKTCSHLFTGQILSEYWPCASKQNTKFFALLELLF